MEDKPILALQPQNSVHCFLDGVNRTDFLEVYKQSGYPVESSLLMESYPQASLMKYCGFENEADFADEHERVASIAKAVNPSATVRSFYYPAHHETSLYRRQS